MSDTSLANPRRERLARLGKRALWRLAGGVLVLWAVATLTFFALRLMPGDPVQAILGGPSGNPTPETIAFRVPGSRLVFGRMVVRSAPCTSRVRP